MTQEEKQLLLKDLCARLPYHPKINIYNDSWEGCRIGEFDNELWYHHIEAFNCDRIEIIPYLRPMSSMTEKEREDLLITLLGKDDTKYFQILPDGSIDNNDVAHKDLSNFNIHWVNFNGVNTSTYIDWLNAHHFDYHGLIEKGLALEAPEGMYKED